MSKAATAYAAHARAGMTGRDLDASALLKAAARLQEAAAPGASRAARDEALTHNRRLWTVLAGAALDPASPLPETLRGSIATLANFVFNHTIRAMSEPAPQALTPLIAINREIAAGLRG